MVFVAVIIEFVAAAVEMADVEFVAAVVGVAGGAVAGG